MKVSRVRHRQLARFLIQQTFVSVSSHSPDALLPISELSSRY